MVCRAAQKIGTCVPTASQTLEVHELATEALVDKESSVTLMSNPTCDFAGAALEVIEAAINAIVPFVKRTKKWVHDIVVPHVKSMISRAKAALEKAFGPLPQCLLHAHCEKLYCRDGP